MIFKKIGIIPYDLKLNRALISSQYTYSVKSGFIIQLYLDGYIGFGEVSPLANYSKESAKQILWGFEELKLSLEKYTDYDKEELLSIFKIFSEKTPSLHFGLDMAFYDILSQRESISIAKYLNSQALDSIKLSSFHFKEERWDNNNIKIKLKCNNILDDFSRICKIINKYNKKTSFRLDANGGYDLKDSIKLCKLLSEYNIEYIEEPFRDINCKRLKFFNNNTNIKVAIDESFFKLDYRKMVENKLIDCVILKPSIYGGVDKIFLLNQYLKENSIKLILSSSLENYIGNLGVIHIAAALELNYPHGINNLLFFNYYQDVLYNQESTKVSISDLIGLGSVWNDI